MKILRYLFITVTALSCLYSCNNAAEQGWKKASGDLQYIIYQRTADTGSLARAEVCIMNLRYQSKDSIFLDSWKAGTPVTMNLRPSEYPGDLFEGLNILKEGDSAGFRLTAKSFFLKTARMEQLPEGVKEGDTLTFVVKIRDVRTRREHNMIIAKELQAINKKRILREEADTNQTTN